MTVNMLSRILRVAVFRPAVRNFNLKPEIIEQNPFKLFRNWYRDASMCGKRCAKDMWLTTVSSDNTPTCRIMKCIEPTNDGFKFAVCEFSQSKADLFENTNVSAAFLWPNQKAVRIEGTIKELPEEEKNEYIYSEDYHNRIVSICAKFHKLLSGRTSLENIIKDLKAKYPQKSDIPPHACVYVLVPKTFEFYHHDKKNGISRLKYEKGLKIDNKFVHPAGEGWTYSFLSP